MNEPPICTMDENSTKKWWLHGTHHRDANAWTQDALKMRNEPCDDVAVESFLRLILVQNQNDLI
jgi:hypothetical protein